MSTLIAFILGFQILVFAFCLQSDKAGPIYRLFRAPTFWPFVDYPMYQSAHYPGDARERHFLFGTLEHGSEVRVRAGDLGLGKWHFRLFTRNAVMGERTADIEHFANLYEQLRGERLVALRLENRPLIFHGDSATVAPTEVLRELRIGVRRGVP